MSNFFGNYFIFEQNFCPSSYQWVGFYVDARNPSSYSGSGNTWNDLSGLGNNGSILNGTFLIPKTKVFI
ncbi:MAG: hypothetical protein CM15mP122_1950 [Bacteroidota bacterium]|nr:MAG: hypothetical protein CM15mP122_1950 [Bacteroidota bacterium]